MLDCGSWRLWRFLAVGGLCALVCFWLLDLSGLCVAICVCLGLVWVVGWVI